MARTPRSSSIRRRRLRREAAATPTDISLSASTVAENASVGATVGTLSATGGSGNTFTLTNSASGKFSIDGETLKVAAALNYEAAASHEITVRATTVYGGTYDESFTITVTNVNEAITDIALSASTVAEDAALGTVVGALTRTDPDSGDTVSYSIVANAQASLTNGAAPGGSDFTDSSAYTLGLQFYVTTSGWINGVTFYRSSASALATGKVSLWLMTGDGTGTLLASKEYSGHSGTGWQTVLFDSPIHVKANTRYNVGHYFQANAGTSYYRAQTTVFASTVTAGFIVAPQNGSNPLGGGVYRNGCYATSDAIPNTTSGTNPHYFVEPLFQADEMFAISGSNLVVGGVLDYESAASHPVTVRATDAGALTYDETFTITVTNVSESAASNPPPTDGTNVNDGGFAIVPYTTTVDGGIKFAGKKNAGAIGKFIYDIGAIASNRIYTVQYDPDFTQLANSGVTAMVGFGLKSGNNFHLVGLKGDGSTGLNKTKVYGSSFNTSSGHTTSSGGAAANGTQAGPNWIQLETSSDGSTYTLRTSSNGTSWTDEYTAQTPSPLASAGAATTFGIAVFLESADAGNFSVKITSWTSVAAGFTPVARRYWRIQVPINESTYAIVGLAEVDFYESSGGSAVTGGTLTATATSEGNVSNLRDGNNTTYWQQNVSNATAAVLTMDWGSSNDKLINEIKLRARSSFPEISPRCIIVESSPDNSTWTYEWHALDSTGWTASEQRTFTRPSPSHPAAAFSSHAYWRVRMYGYFSSSVYAIREAEFRATVGGADQATGGTPSVSLAVHSGFEATKAFDDNGATWMETSAAALACNLTYQFASAVLVEQVGITVDNAAKAPMALAVQYSDDGSAWTTAWVASPGAAWVAGTQKLFARPYST